MATVTSKLALVPEEGQPGVAPFRGVAHVQVDAGDISGFDVVQLFNLNALHVPIIVENILCDITEAFTASTTLTVGDGGDVDRFMDSTAVGPTATGTKNMNEDAQPGSSGYRYSTADTIDLVVGGVTPAAGTIDVYLFYTMLGSL